MDYDTNAHVHAISKSSTLTIEAIACLMVILSHFGSYCGIRTFAPLGAGGVSSFLIMSGYGLSLSADKSNLKYFWEKRILRVLIPYWMVRLFVYGVMFCMGNETALLTILFDLLLINPLGPNCWYLQFAFIWYGVFWVCQKYLKQYKKTQYAVYLIIGVLIFAFGNSLWAKQALAFPIGILLAHRQKNTSPATIKSIMLRFTYCFSVFVACLFLRNCIITNMLLHIEYAVVMLQNLCLSGCVILIGCAVVSMPAIIGKAFAMIGTVSYELYLVHGYLEYPIRENGITALAVLYILVLSILLHQCFLQFKHIILRKQEII